MKKRREFLSAGLWGTSCIAIGGMGISAKSYSSIIGSNERINLAVIGIRSRGGSHIKTYCTLKSKKNVQIKTICDTDEQLFSQQLKNILDYSGDKPKVEWDMQKVFEDPEIHAVSFATPNHWHALGTIWAAMAGKHVYVEKPVCHNIFEGRKMIEASRKYNVRIQSGFNMRSGYGIIEAINFLHKRGIGEVYMARGLCIKSRPPFGIAKDSAPPVSLHYDRWLGPAQWRPYNGKKGHYNWHWFWDTGNGDTGNQGPHQFDIARWGLNKNEHPSIVYSSGGIYGFSKADCAQETPNIQISIFKYRDGRTLVFDTRGLSSNGESSLDIRIGNIFYGTDGYLEIHTNETWKAFRNGEKLSFAGSKEQKDPNDDCHINHFGNFIDAIRSGHNEALNCDIIEGHYSSALSHLANISYRLGRELRYDDNKEKFINDNEADSMLSRIYRDPYIVPDKV